MNQKNNFAEEYKKLSEQGQSILDAVSMFLIVAMMTCAFILIGVHAFGQVDGLIQSEEYIQAWDDDQNFGSNHLDTLFFDSTFFVIIPSMVQDFKFDLSCPEDYCETRGHVESEIFIRTRSSLAAYVEDTDSTSYLITPSNEIKTYMCFRCRQFVEERGEPTKSLIWKKQ